MDGARALAADSRHASPRISVLLRFPPFSSVIVRSAVIRCPRPFDSYHGIARYTLLMGVQTVFLQYIMQLFKI